ncbi:MAG: lamin tail domain-containing protein [Bacteroidota bacterium]
MLRTLFVVFMLLLAAKVSAQVVDNFSDGDFTANPTWSGTTADFIVNSSQQLQLNNTVAATSYLSTPHNLPDLNAKEWRIWVKQSFSPSSSNYGRVYLTADNADLTLVQNGYYLQFGEANAIDAIRLFKIQGGVATQLCTGVDGQIANSFTVRVRVKRDAVGNWSLFADLSGGQNFILQGTANDPGSLTGTHFGVLDTYTSSNANKFFYDEIYIGNESIDNQPPILNSATANSPTQVDVFFNESLDPTSAQNAINYSINPNISISSATLDPLNTSLVHVTTGTALTNGTSYSLTTTNISDNSTNISGNQTVNFQYLIAESVLPGDVIINEFFPDPTPVIGLPEVEFVEIYNKSNKIFNLNGWKIGDASSDGSIENSWLLPGEFKVLTASANIPAFATTLAIGVTSFPSLNNAADDVILKDNFGQIIDKLSFTNEWYGDEDKKNGGYSLELINPNDPCSDSDNWIASTWILGGTPGFLNSVFNPLVDVDGPEIDFVLASSPNYLEFHFNEGMDSLSLVLCSLTFNPELTVQNRFIPEEFPSTMLVQFNESLVPSQLYTYNINPILDCWGNGIGWNGEFVLPENPETGDVIINEILQNPLNGGQDWIELYNNSDKVINLKDWQFANYEGDTIANFKSIANNYLLQPKDYVVVGEDSSFVKQNYPFAIPGKFLFSELPSYNNDSGTVYLIYNAEIIDKVSYLDEWHFDLLDNTDGVSLERIDPKGESSSSFNWHSAAEDIGFATPGRINSQFRPAVSNGEISFTEDILSPDNDGYQDVLQINYNLTNSGLLGKAQIYDDRGRLIKTIFTNELLGSFGTFSWDGTTNQHVKASIGVYLLVFEVFSTDGGVFFTRQKGFTLAGKL